MDCATNASLFSSKHWLTHVGSRRSRIERCEFTREKTIEKLEYTEFTIRKWSSQVNLISLRCLGTKVNKRTCTYTKNLVILYECVQSVYQLHCGITAAMPIRWDDDQKFKKEIRSSSLSKSIFARILFGRMCSWWPLMWVIPPSTLHSCSAAITASSSSKTWES